LFLHNI